MIARFLLPLVLLLCSVASTSAMSLGVTVANGLVRSESQVKALAGYLESRLGEPVTWRVFASDKVLHDWLNRFREIDLAVLDADYLQGQVPGEFFRLGRGVRPDGSATALVVMRQGSDPKTLERAQQALLSMDQSNDGKAVLATLGLGQFVAAPRVLPSQTAAKASQKPKRIQPPPPPPVVRKAAPSPYLPPVAKRRSVPAAKSAAVASPRSVPPVAAVKPQRVLPPPPMVSAPLPSSASSKTLALGVLPGNSLVRTEAEAGRFVAYLAEGLGMPVTVRVFADKQALQHWLSDQPGSELAVLDAVQAGSATPQLTRLARIVRPGGRRQEALVIRDDADPLLQGRVRELLLGMSGNPVGLRVLGEVGLEGFAAETAATAPSLLPPPQPVPTPVVKAVAPRPVPVAAAVAPQAKILPLPRDGVQAERQGRWDDAIRLYQQTLAAQPGQVELWLRIADIQAMRGQPHDAALSMLWMLDAIADDAALYHRLSQAHAVNGQFRAALAASNQAVALDPGNDDYLRSRAQLAAWVGDPVTVRESYLQILTRSWAD